MVKLIVRHFINNEESPQIIELSLPNPEFCQVAIIHDNGTETVLISGNEIKSALAHCDCPNNRCVKQHMPKA